MYAPQIQMSSTIYSLLEEYGHILKSNSVAKECQNAIKAAILHFYKQVSFAVLTMTDQRCATEI